MNLFSATSTVPKLSAPQRGIREGERICWIWRFDHQNSIFSIIMYLSRQRVTLPQSIGEGPGMGLN